MSPTVRLQLSVMMFLQYFVWGAWYVTMGTYLLTTLHFSAQQSGLLYGTTALAAMVSPFFVGMVADRFFATEKILATLHLVGAVLLFYISGLTTFGSFYPLLLTYTLLFMPTLALTNSLSFHQMTDTGKQFPGVRVLGTIGWIAAGVAISALGAEAVALQFKVAAGASVLLGLFCFTLPHTPPARIGHKVQLRDILGLDALELMKERSFAVFVLGSFLVCIPLQFYYAFTNPFLNELGMTNTAGIQSLGQVSEIAFMLVMPLFFARLGVKYMLLVGMLAWVARYALFAIGAPDGIRSMIIAGIVLHGICYDFFFVTGFIYTDKKAGPAIRAQAQGFLVLVTQGLGMLIGAQVSGVLFNRIVIGEGQVLMKNWQQFWFIPAAAAAIVAVIFFLLFRDRADEPAVKQEGFDVGATSATPST